MPPLQFGHGCGLARPIVVTVAVFEPIALCGPIAITAIAVYMHGGPGELEGKAGCHYGYSHYSLVTGCYNHCSTLQL